MGSAASCVAVDRRPHDGPRHPSRPPPVPASLQARAQLRASLSNADRPPPSLAHQRSLSKAPPPPAPTAHGSRAPTPHTTPAAPHQKTPENSLSLPRREHLAQPTVPLDHLILPPPPTAPPPREDPSLPALVLRRLDSVERARTSMGGMERGLDGYLGLMPPLERTQTEKNVILMRQAASGAAADADDDVNDAGNPPTLGSTPAGRMPGRGQLHLHGH